MEGGIAMKKENNEVFIEKREQKKAVNLYQEYLKKVAELKKEK